MLKDPLTEASFGLGISYFMFLFWSLNLGCSEITSMECAYYWGTDIKTCPNKLRKMSAAVVKGLIVIVVCLIFTAIMFFFSTEILIAISISEENAVLTGYMVKWLIPGAILQGVNFQLGSFILAQGKNFYGFV